jgi:nitrogen-specific signal transduction histidine kinase
MFKFWLEYDINPLIIFNQKGHIHYCNQEAEIFLSYINKKDVFEFAIKNASNEKGIKTEFKKIRFGDFEFNGYSVGYQDEEFIGIRFFINTNTQSIYLEELEKADISMIINFAMEYMSLKKEIKFSTYFDPSIPEIYINKKALLDLLFEIFENYDEIFVKTKVNIGEYIKLNGKKYPLISLIVNVDNPKHVKNQFFEIINKENGYSIQIPLIKDKK